MLYYSNLGRPCFIYQMDDDSSLYFIVKSNYTGNWKVMRRVKYKDTTAVVSGSNIIEDITLFVSLIGQVFIIYLMFELMIGFVWWLCLGLSVSITTALYFFIKYIVDYFYKV